MGEVPATLARFQGKSALASSRHCVVVNDDSTESGGAPEGDGVKMVEASAGPGPGAGVPPVLGIRESASSGVGGSVQRHSVIADGSAACSGAACCVLTSLPGVYPT